MTIPQNRIACRIARKYAPTIVQGFVHAWDCLCPITLDGHFESDKPTVYYSVLKDGRMLYCLYAFYHWQDFSMGQFGGYIRDKLDSHRHDFEGVLFAIDSEGVYPTITASVFHHDLLLTIAKGFSVYERDVYIEAQGHGVRFGGAKLNDPVYLRYSPDSYDLVNMRAGRFLLKWKQIKEEFNRFGVNMPDQWNDWNMRKKFGKETDGDIWHNPKRLIGNAVKLGRLPEIPWITGR